MKKHFTKALYKRNGLYKAIAEAPTEALTEATEVK